MKYPDFQIGDAIILRNGMAGAIIQINAPSDFPIRAECFFNFNQSRYFYYFTRTGSVYSNGDSRFDIVSVNGVEL